MAVNATFQPPHVSSPPGAAAALTLQLHNDNEIDQTVHLKALGLLADHTVLQSQTVHLEAGERFEVPVIVDVGQTLAAGAHTSAIEVLAGDGPAFTAEATIDVEATPSYSVSLMPERSVSALAGRHRIVVENRGNVPMMVELLAESLTDTSVTEIAAPMVTVDPGATAKVEVKVHPRHRFWRGAATEHPFAVQVIGSDGTTNELTGVYEQGPRVRPWLLPALVGMLGALLIGTLAWFTLLKPWVESTAEDRAEEVNEADRALLDEKIAELEQAAADARALPLGSPADLRLNVDAAPGGSATESFTVAADRVLSVTDVVFQNPGGSVGRVALVRSGEVLLESELANFRDLDFHFVAPFRFDGGDTVEVRVDCDTPGPNEASCIVGASIVGFVDAAG
ncbi:MAG: hypothetical protein HKN44_13230 [Ilumatobacter sp.]|nr:hypothetical protein [Ilumatobacter sp.]